jgi:hypothetical protein
MLLALQDYVDVLAIKAKFSREFCLASGRETAKSIARANLEQVDFWKALLIFKYSQNFCLSVFFLRFVPFVFSVDRGGEVWERHCTARIFFRR